MNWKLTNRLVAGAVFLFALVLYLLTMAPTVSFWDPGERIAVSYGLQIPHPPGAPFYMLLSRVFSMFVPTEYVAPAINLVSVLASAFSVLFAYLIIVHLVRRWQGRPEAWTPSQRIIALASGVIGACTFAVTDSFWYNAGIAETYALSLFFTAVVIWLILKWSGMARREEKTLPGQHHHLLGLRANRYLILIAYLFGLAIGVHLLNLLAIFFIGLIIYFTEFDRAEWSPTKRWQGILLTGLVTSGAFLVIYPGIIQVLPDLIGGSGAPLLMLLLLIGLVIFGLYYTQTRSMQAASLVMLCVTMILIGYTSYALIPIRSAADPPIDQNNPESLEELISFLKREQYGAAPLLRGPTYDNALGRVDQDREVLFPRRHSPDPSHLQVYDRYSSDWEFFWKYQVGHMYARYFLWNFSGRSSDVQDAPAVTGFRFIDQHIEEPTLRQTPSEEQSRQIYFALPLLLGLLGMAYHFHRDWRRAFSVFVLFLITGLGIIVYLNQTPLQPRERDYSYVGSFFAFSLWIGIGAGGLLELTREAVRDWFSSGRARRGAMLGMAGLLFLAVPMIMLSENYYTHDRSDRYVARDYAFNMLTSVEENAIVFTNGDNDTFPLWYLQEVEGVRQDVRVVNLSLLQTPWYVRQLKNNWARESPPLPISFSEERIDDLAPTQWSPREMQLPVDPAALNEHVFIPEAEQGQIESPMTWQLEGRPFAEQFNILLSNDQVVYNILRNVAEEGWERPVYFAVTTGQDGQIGLQNYFQIEGMAQRVVPIRHNISLGRVVPSVSDERLRQFRFTNLDDPGVYYDETIRNMVNYYRTWYAHTAQELAQQGQPEDAREIMDYLMAHVPFETIPGTPQTFMLVAQAYEDLGDRERMLEYIKYAEPMALHELQHARSQQRIDYAVQYVQMIRFAYMDAGDFEAASDLSGRLATILGDATLEQSPDELRSAYHDEEPETADTLLNEPSPVN